jgi:Ca2+-binding EF-hand superfamily protein
METFGIQLDDDSLLALFYVYDKGCTGYLRYEDLMRVLLDSDYYALYTGQNDITQAAADLTTVKGMVASIKAKFKSSVEDLRKVLQCLDTNKTGTNTLRRRLGDSSCWQAHENKWPSRVQL